VLNTLGRVFRFESRYGRLPPLILVNGLAEQGETWFRNIPVWRKHFEIHTPNILAYDGDALHERIDTREPVSVDYIVEELHKYLHRFVQHPPYFLGGSSTGGKVVAVFAHRYPKLVDKLILFGPSGLSDVERLPVVQGVRRHDVTALVDSVFYNPRRADPRLLGYYKEKMASRRWRIGLIKTIRGTLGHSIREVLPELPMPTIMFVGMNDSIVDAAQAIEAGKRLPKGKLVVIDNCGHAPHLEFTRQVNKQVIQFLKSKG